MLETVVIVIILVVVGVLICFVLPTNELCESLLDLKLSEILIFAGVMIFLYLIAKACHIHIPEESLP
jgi:hypothetical protein